MNYHSTRKIIIVQRSMTITTINELLIVFGQSFHKTFFFFKSCWVSPEPNYERQMAKCTKKSLWETFTSWTWGKTTCFALKYNCVDNEDRCITQAKRTNQFQCLNEVWNSFGLSNSSSCCVAIQLNNERSIDRIFNFYSFFFSILPIRSIKYAGLWKIPYHLKFWIYQMKMKFRELRFVEKW